MLHPAARPETPSRKNCPPVRETGHMAEGDIFRFDDPDGYAAKFGDIGVDLTITGAGDFQSRLTRLKLKHVDIYRCYENLPRIAYISLPAEPVFLSFPVGNAS